MSEVLTARARPDLDLTGLARAVCDVYRAYVPYDFACLATTDPSTGLISWAYKSRPLAVGDEEFAAAEYGGGWDVNLFSELATRTEPVGVLSIDTGGDPDSCRRFREFLVPRFGFSDELRVVFRSRGLSWGAIALYRAAGEPPFRADEAATAVGVAEQVAGLVQQALFHGGRATPGSPGAACVVVVDGDDRVTNMTPGADGRIAELGGWDNGSLPAAVLATTTAARSTPELAVNRAVARDGTWLVIRATAFAQAPSADGSTGRGDVVVTIDVASPADISALTLAAHGLSRREQEVTGLVLQGADTKAIAASLHLSPHTVQDHLKSVFVKLGVNSRREMVRRLVLG